MTLWLLVFSGLIIYKEYTLQTGTEVTLKTVPVDPRDLFRGDYVVLRYEISNLDLNEIPADKSDFEYRDRIYLVLKLVNGYGVPEKIYSRPPEDELYLTGTVIRKMGNVKNDKEILIVEYGIESYFVPEGRGREIEKEQWSGKGVDVKVAIGRQGKAVIKALLIDGKKVNF